MPRENEKKLIQKIHNRITNQSDKDIKNFMNKILAWETSVTKGSWRKESYPSMIEEAFRSSDSE